MKINVDRLRDRSKKHFLIVETWQGMEPTASYREQAQAVRRGLDALEYIEDQFQKGTVVMAHKEASSPTSYQIIAVDDNEQLNDYLKANAAHARVRPELRKVVPMSDWDAGTETFKNMIADLERLAREEERATTRGRFRTVGGAARRKGPKAKR
jgi:predicted HNH restriction endonuclease